MYVYILFNVLSIILASIRKYLFDYYGMSFNENNVLFI